MIHNIKFRAFVYENEDIDEISQGILNILPESSIEIEEAEGLMENRIFILSGVVSKKKYTKTFFNSLLDLDTSKLNDDLERKIDDKGNWFLRFSKTDAIDEKLTIVEDGDSIHLKIKIAAYPAKKDIAVDKIRNALN